MKKHIALLLVIVFSILFALPVSAGDAAPSQTVRIDLEDGSYIIEEITETENGLWATSTKSGTKTSTKYASDGTALYAVKVTGTFKYTGSASWSTASSATVSIYDSDVTYVSKSATYASNYAKATGKVSYLGVSESRTVTLYCSATGALS